MDQSQELLYRASATEHKVMATALITSLKGFREQHPTKEEPPHYLSITRIAQDMETSFTRTPQLSINRMNITPKKEQKQFEYRNKVQCKACGLFGHCLEHSQTCRFLAQYMNCNKYAIENEERATSNQKEFNESNSIRSIKMMSLIPEFNAKICTAQTKLELDHAIMDAHDEYQQKMGSKE